MLPKTGDLQGILEYKFKHLRQEYWMVYRPPTDEEMKVAEVGD